MRGTIIICAAVACLTAGAQAQTVSITARPDTTYTQLADGFDFPVGHGEGDGYYKARGYQANGHQGEDWDGIGGGDTDLRDPIASIGAGVVVLARDVHLGWGNVVIVRSAFREGGQVKTVDALYGHLDSILVSSGQRVARGQQLGTMGTAHGMYDAHLHLEIRKNLEIGMNRAAFPQDFSNYYDPTEFIRTHRHLATTGGNYPIATNTFKHDAPSQYEFARNFTAKTPAPAEGPAPIAGKKVINFERVSPLHD